MITFGSALKYTFMPRILPRLWEMIPDTVLFAQLMAQVFYNIGLLPKGHQLLLPANEGRFGISQVMAAAAANLKGGWRHSDQYIVYASFVLGLLLLALQFVALFIILISQTAQAAGPFTSMFITPDPTDDIALMMLDKVFQIPGFFNTGFDPNNTGAIEPLARGMQELFKFYSGGMLIIAFFIVLYYIFALTVETVKTGKPFGKRFPTVYGPIRLVLAILLLLPLAYGYNSGQYLTLLMARWGSSFATNAWLVYNGYMAATPMNNPMGLTPSEMIAKPKPQPINSLVNFFYLVHTCKAGYKIAYDRDIKPYFVVPADTKNTTSSATIMTAASTYLSTLNLFNSGDIVITFGEKNAKYSKYPGNVKPYCGVLTIPIQAKDVDKVKDIYDAYFNYIASLWTDPDFDVYGENMAYIDRFMVEVPAGHVYMSPSVGWYGSLNPAVPTVAGAQFYSDMRVLWQSIFNADIDAAIVNMRTNAIAKMQMTAQVLDFGWGGAGIWYNHIAEYNGAMADAVIMIPGPTDYPMIMKHVASTKKKLESSSNPKERFSPSSITDDNVSIEKFWSGADLDDPAMDAELAKLFDDVYQTVADDDITAAPKTSAGANNPLKVLFKYVYEQTGLMDVRDNSGVNPIAKLSMLGKTIIDKTIFALGVGTLVSGFGGLISGAGASELGAAFEEGGGILLGFASTGLVMGFVLFYLIPLFPFLYFFLSVGRWVKSIFEAMVAVPLWALAHLRLDGEGVGNAASKGYFLLFEIFIRPILVVFGLLAAVTIFSALVIVLDSIFDLVVWNVASFDMSSLDSTAVNPSTDFLKDARGGIDGLFFTIFYTILVYMMATSCFKLIDLIPSKLMRFLQPVPTFHDGAGDPAENLVRNVAIGGHVLTAKLGQGFGDFAKGTGQSVGKIFKQGMGDKMGGPD